MNPNMAHEDDVATLASRPRPAWPCDDEDESWASSWPHAALRALDAPCVVLDVVRERVLWCAPSFQRIVGEGDLGMPELFGRLKGLEEAMAAYSGLAIAHGPRAASLRLEGRPMEARLHWLNGSHLMLHLTDRAGEAQARQRHLEDREQLLFTSRMLSIGEMATTLAHEINQPIGAAANLLRGVLMRMEPQQKEAHAAGTSGALIQALQRAVDQVMFASKVIARIREYTHLHTPQRKAVDVVATVRACAGLLDWETEREGVRVNFDLPTKPLWIEADELMLQQVLVNLMRNAIDAMRGNAPGQRHLDLSVRLDGPQVEVIVCDSGSGISAESEGSLFTPFVSSKPTGTGIGLNICRSFIELHRGRLWFSRNADRGISFHASLPLNAQQPAAPSQSRS